MAATICPTVTTHNPHEYRDQMEELANFATRVHIDLADGSFTPNKLLPPTFVWWPGGVRADLHVMYRRPYDHVPVLVALGPQLIIVHAEADGDFESFATHVHQHGIEAGIALLPETGVELIEPALEHIDHVLIFSGNLGHQGGSHADLALLDKVKRLKDLKPQLEIGWDGGVNEQNAAALMAGGVEVLNVGGFIAHAADPTAAYATLKGISEGSHGETHP